MSIPAAAWNQGMISRAKNRIAGVRVVNGRRFEHPWRTSIRWSFVRKQWEARINPGYLNAEEVAAPAAAILPVEPDPDDEANQPLLARQAESALWLSDQPSIPLTRFRGGEERPNLGAVPDFFGQWPLAFAEGQASGLGNLQPDSLTGRLIQVIDPIAEAARAEANEAAGERGRRRLRAVTLVLEVPRPTLGVEVVPGVAGVDDFAVELRLGVVAPPPGVSRARLLLSLDGAGEPAVLPDALAPPPDLAGILTGVPEAQRPYDRLPIATAWMLSPAGVSADAAVDRTWRPFVEHHEFWNLRHHAVIPPPGPEQPRFAMQRGLGLGSGDAIISEQLRRLNEASNQTAAFLAANIVGGRFWS